MIMTLKLSNNTVEIPINPIRHARMMYGLTQAQLANITGIPHRTIQNWEGGQRKCPEYVANMVLGLLDRELGQPDYKGILEDLLDALERDLKFLKTDEAKTITTNTITAIKDSLKA
jgi:transcriptional regulator with XRE-family HTH domain